MQQMEPIIDEQSIEAHVKKCIDVLRLPSTGAERADIPTLKKAAHSLVEWCKDDRLVELIVKEQAVETVAPLLDLGAKDSDGAWEEVEKDACFILGLLAVKPEYQTRIANCGALKGLVRLLRAHRKTAVTKLQPGSGGVARRAADAITNLAHENVIVKNLVRQEEGIPPLVGLLDAWDIKVQKAAAGALRTLAFKNEENKNQIVQYEALPKLVQLLRSEDVGVHYEAIGVIGNLVHSSANIKRKVLDEGALQPIINLLNSACQESQREAALLLGQFSAAPDGDWKGRIAQRGAIPALIRMFGASDIALKEMAAFALGRLAQSADNQAGIVQCGGLKPLLELLEAKNHNLQHMAAFALYGLAENEDNVPDILKEGGYQRLMTCADNLSVQPSKDCVAKTISRIETKLSIARIFNHTIYMLRSADARVQQTVAVALARLAPKERKQLSVLVDNRGLDVLSDVLMDPRADPATQKEASGALLLLAKKINELAPIADQAGPSQPVKTVYLGAQYVNSPTLSDVTFTVEGRPLYAHRIALLASSDAFRAMFDGGYREKEVDNIPIPNIRYEVFEAMMQYIYTGLLEPNPDMARELLQAADQYLLSGLKLVCETCIAGTLTVDTLGEVLVLSEAHAAPQLGKRCVMFALEHYDDVVSSMGTQNYAALMGRMLPLLRPTLHEDLRNCPINNTRTESPMHGGSTPPAGAGNAVAAAPNPWDGRGPRPRDMWAEDPLS